LTLSMEAWKWTMLAVEASEAVGVCATAGTMVRKIKDAARANDRRGKGTSDEIENANSKCNMIWRRSQSAEGLLFSKGI